MDCTQKSPQGLTHHGLPGAHPGTTTARHAMTTTTYGWIVQRQEDHPHNPGCWRFSRPSWVATDAELPTSGFPESIRWSRGSRQDLTAAQAEWDQANPRG